MSQARPALEAMGEELLRLLPRDGAAIPNRAALAMLSKRLGHPVSNESYFEARERLLSKGLVGRVRGQGGSVYLLSDAPSGVPDPDEDADGGPSERKLMAPLHMALKTSFRATLDLPRDAPDPIIEDISTRGPKRGIWARPDFVFVSVSKFAMLPGAHVDVHVFELKNEAGAGVRAVHEALAQARFANFAHLVWYLPEGSAREPELDELVTHCGLHGVGFCRMKKPGTLEVLQDAKRTSTTPLEIDGFLESRLSADGKAALKSAISTSNER
jgi:hypothetical protein